MVGSKFCELEGSLGEVSWDTFWTRLGRRMWFVRGIGLWGQ